MTTEGCSTLPTTVIRTTRRTVTLADTSGSILNAFNPPRSLDIVAGDRVQWEQRGADLVIERVMERKNCLRRSVPEREKRLAANLDRLFIVAAVPPLFNTLLIDRISVAAAVEDIPCVLIINKVDLGANPRDLPYSEYLKTGMEMKFISALKRSGLEELEKLLKETPAGGNVALAGQSGVGKSTVLNILIPGADAQVAEVSEKTGQGRQTTSSGFAYHYEKSRGETLFLIDLPGIQNFGIHHLTSSQVRWGFAEFRDAAAECQFDDCMHLAEPGCNVKRLLARNVLSSSRYESYLDMMRELELGKRY